MLLALVCGLPAGAATGVVLQRSGLCFHAMFDDAWGGRTHLLRGWLLAVAVAAVGLAVLYLTPWSHGLNTGLAFRPVGNVGGGLLIGIGMAVARSCASGLFTKLGAGMLGALVGLAGWALGELAASRLSIPGPTVLGGGESATVPGVLGVPRLLAALVLLVAVVGALLVRRTPSAAARAEAEQDRWSWPVTGLALGAATVAGWVLARLGGASFGPSTVGAVRGLSVGTPTWWLTAFLVGLAAGAHLTARATGALWVRGETTPRYAGLAAGGLLLGAGGWIAGGCNLGHGLSGAAQLDVSSWVVVASMATGVGLARVVRRVGLRRRPAPRARPGERTPRPA